MMKYVRESYDFPKEQIDIIIILVSKNQVI